MTVHLERHGSGAPLVLVHGLGGDRTTWAPVVPLLARHCEVVVVELPGFGASDPLPGDVEPSPAALARAVGRALAEHGLADAHLAGVSLGAWVALELALQGTGRGVTALCPAGFWPTALVETRGSAHRVARRLDRVLPTLMRSRRLRRSVLGGVLGGPARFTRDEAVAVLRGYGRSTDFLRVNTAMRTRTFRWSRQLPLVAERVPVDVAWGAEDRLVVPPRDRLPDVVRVEVLAGCGHLPMYDDPRATADLLLRSAAVSGAATADAPRPADDDVDDHAPAGARA